MKKIILTILLALTTTMLYAETAPSSENIKFTLTNTEGKKINITESEEGLIFEEHKGKAIFLIMFGHSCPPCKAEIPEFIELTTKYKDKLTIIAIEAQRSTVEQLKKFKKDNGINYSLVTGRDHDDFVGYIAQRAHWSGAIPLLIALDKNGAVQTVQPGFIPRETFEGLIEKLTK